GFAHEHALLAVTGQGQCIEFACRCRGGDRGDGLVEQLALLQQAQFEAVRQHPALFVTYQAPVLPGAGLTAALGQGQGALAVVLAAGEIPAVGAAIGQGKQAFAFVLPVGELAEITGAVVIGIFTGALHHPFDELAGPGLAASTLIAALAVELVVLKSAAVVVAICILVAALAVEQTLGEYAAELVAVGIDAHALALWLAFDELALETAAISHFQFAQAMKAVVEKFPLVALTALFKQPDAAEPVAFETAFVAAAIAVGQGALAMEHAFVKFTQVVLAAGPLPFAAAFEHAVLELADEPAAIAVVQAARALQQSVDDLAAILTAIGQGGVGRQQRACVVATGDQQGQAKRQQAQGKGIHGRRPGRCFAPQYAASLDACAVASHALHDAGAFPFPARMPETGTDGGQTKQRVSGSAM